MIFMIREFDRTTRIGPEHPFYLWWGTLAFWHFYWDRLLTCEREDRNGKGTG